jgi:nucleotide-binding universal stress UspA family protein
VAFRKILIAIDSDAVAARAAEVGGELAHELRAQLALVHVTDNPGPRAEMGAAAQDDERALRRHEGKRLLSDFHRRLSPTTAALEFIEAGNPAEEIVKTAKNWPADLIVIGSHGRTGMRRALLGSVAEAVMRGAPCPVLVVRAQA